RMARVDSWVVALCIGSCWLLHNEVNNEEGSVKRGRLMMAGGLAAAAALVWPSAVFLYPLIALELIHPRTSERIFQRTWWQYIVPRVLYFVIGGLISLLALLLPVWENMTVIIQDMSNMVAQNVNASKTTLERIFVFFDYQVWLKLIKALVKTFTPLLPLLAIAGMLLHRGRGLILVTAITLAVIFSSLVYEFRVLYLLPYFVVLSSGIFIKIGKSSTRDKFPRPWLKRASTLALAGLVTWSVGTSLVARTVLGLKGKSERDRDHFQKLASSSIGAGNYKVFLGFTYEFYFVGRSLGWQLYTPYIQFTYDSEGNWLRESDYKPKHQFIKLLSQMDYAIFSKGSINEELTQELNSSGLHYSTTLQVGKVPTSSAEDSKMGSVFMWFLEGKKSYGSYVLYARTEALGKN
ncbi:MAG: hypothetical protein LPK07_04305, partial [Hymenobacteraceae bacterium]|nr:hypothetical protein [Hymenobacteraceae bacterium]